MAMNTRMPQLVCLLKTSFRSIIGSSLTLITDISTTEIMAQKVMPKPLRVLTQAASVNRPATPGSIHMTTVPKKTTTVTNSRACIFSCCFSTFCMSKS